VLGQTGESPVIVGIGWELKITTWVVEVLPEYHQVLIILSWQTWMGQSWQMDDAGTQPVRFAVLGGGEQFPEAVSCESSQ